MVEKLKITILTDKTSWMYKYNTELKQKLENLGHDANIIMSKQDLKKGDIAFFLSCFEIIPKEYLELNTHNIVVHESALPQGKGWSPMTWQILEGKNKIAITLFEAGKEVDSGEIYLQDIITLDGTELVDEWREKQGKKSIEMCLSFVQNYNSIKGKKQQGTASTYSRRTTKDSELDINKSIVEQFNLLRTVDNENYPAFFIRNGTKYILKIFKEELK